MDRFPLLREGKSAGELTVERDALYICFSAVASVPEGLWCVWLIGEQGEVRLGVLEPQGKRSMIRRRFSGRMAAPLGRLLRGEVRPVSRGASVWADISEPAGLFQSAWLRQRLKECRGGLVRRETGRLYLALPYGEREPFGLETLFCFAHVQNIAGKQYAVFLFDEEEWPLLL